MYMVAAIITIYGCWLGEVIETLRNLRNFESIEVVFECARVSIPLTACGWIDFFMR
jgi:hypothetical protein